MFPGSNCVRSTTCLWFCESMRETAFCTGPKRPGDPPWITRRHFQRCSRARAIASPSWNAASSAVHPWRSTSPSTSASVAAGTRFRSFFSGFFGASGSVRESLSRIGFRAIQASCSFSSGSSLLRGSFLIVRLGAA